MSVELVVFTACRAYPDMSKGRVDGAFTISSEGLGDDRRDGHGNSEKTVLEYAEEDDLGPQAASVNTADFANTSASTYIEPRQSASRRPKMPPHSATSTLLTPVYRPHPRLRHQSAKIALLIVEIGRHVVTEEGEEAGNGECLVASHDDFEVDGMSVEEVGKERDNGVDGDHEEDADDTVGVRRSRVALKSGINLTAFVCRASNNVSRA
jgi:hypothetical protein